MAGPVRRHAGGLDPMLHVDRDTGRVFTADIQGVVGCSAILSFSDDEGASWTTTEVCGLTDHQNIFTGPPAVSQTVGYPNVVYYCAADGGARTSYSTATSCNKSIDGGLSWARTGTPAFQNDPTYDGGFLGVPGHCGGLGAHGFVDREGTVYLPRGWCGQPWLAISKDEGATWERVQVAETGIATSESGIEEHEAAVAVDKKGTIYYVWTGKNRLPYLATSENGGESWSKPMMIGPPGIKEANLPNMDVGRDGRIAVAYVGSTNAPGGKAPDGEGPEYQRATWNVYVTLSTNAGSRNPLFYTAPLNDPADPLVVGNCGIVGCQQIFDFIDLDIGPDGAPWVSFVDGCPPSGECYGVWGYGIVGTLAGATRLR